MSTMKWTFKGTKDAFTPNADKITVTEYEFYTDSRGNPQGTTTTQYYEGNVPPSKGRLGQYSPPQGKQLKLEEDFTFESPKKNIGNNGHSWPFPETALHTFWVIAKKAEE